MITEMTLYKGMKLNLAHPLGMVFVRNDFGSFEAYMKVIEIIEESHDDMVVSFKNLAYQAAENDPHRHLFFEAAMNECNEIRYAWLVRTNPGNEWKVWRVAKSL